MESCGGMGLRKGFGGFCSHLEGSGSVLNVTEISQSVRDVRFGLYSNVASFAAVAGF